MRSGDGVVVAMAVGVVEEGRGREGSSGVASMEGRGKDVVVVYFQGYVCMYVCTLLYRRGVYVCTAIAN